MPTTRTSAFLKEATPDKLRDMPWLYPHFVTEAGDLKLSIHALLVEAPGLKLVVDTCVGNDKPRALFGKVGLQTGFLKSLEATGCRRTDVNAVVCTHLHVDHVGWNTMLEGRQMGAHVPERALSDRQAGIRVLEAGRRQGTAGNSHRFRTSRSSIAASRIWWR